MTIGQMATEVESQTSASYDDSLLKVWLILQGRGFLFFEPATLAGAQARQSYEINSESIPTEVINQAVEELSQ